MPDCIPEEASKEGNRVTLRSELESVLRTDPELDAFILDQFPDTYRQLAVGMMRTQKLNILLEKEAPDDLASALRRLAAAKVGRSKGLARRAWGGRQWLFVVLCLSPLLFAGLGLAAYLAGAASATGRGLVLRDGAESSTSPFLRSQPSGAEVWDLRTGERLGTTPLLLDPRLGSRSLCLRRSGVHDRVLGIFDGQPPREPVILRPLGASVAEVCDVPIPIIK